MNKFYSMIGMAKKAGVIVSGETGCIQSIKKGRCNILIIAEDSSDNTKSKFTALCNRYGTKYILTGNKSDLGYAIGKGLTATVAVNDANFSKSLVEKIDNN